MKLTIDVFRSWQKDPVTRAVMTMLEDLSSQIKELQTSSDIIMAEDAMKHLARMVGQKDILDVILNLEFSSIEEIDDEDTSDSTSSAS